MRLAQLRFNDRESSPHPVELEKGTRTVMSASSNAQWVEPNVVVFVREGVLMGQRVGVEAGRPPAARISSAMRRIVRARSVRADTYCTWAPSSESSSAFPVSLSGFAPLATR